MKDVLRRCLLPLVLLAGLLLPAVCLAAGELSFPDKSVTLFEGEQMEVPLVIQEGLEGELKFVSTNTRIARVDENGMLLALSRGEVTITATLKTEKRSYSARLKVYVRRPVTGIQLNENGLTILTEEDGAVFRAARALLSGYLSDVVPEEQLAQTDRVLILKKGASAQLRVKIEPSTASDRSFSIYSAQTEVLRVSKTTVKALQEGAGFLLISSVSNPSVSVSLPVLVITPVSKVTVTAEKTTLSIGYQTQAILTIAPENATLRAVEWKSDNEKVASVDENGLITANGKGKTAIRVMTADGSKKVGYVNVTVIVLPTSVTLKDEVPLILNAGETRKLTAQVEPEDASDKQLIWSSTDESVATVNENGAVTANAQGQCEIVCASQARPGVEARLPVIVVKLVSKVQFAQKTGELLAGQKGTLNLTVEPEDATNPAVAFTSSDPQVARVDEWGTVTAMAPGTAALTAAAQDGSGKQDTLTLTVIERPQSVSITQTGPLTLTVGRKCQVTAVVYPIRENNNRIAWASTDETVAAVSPEGIVTGKGSGECDIVAISQADLRVSDRIRVIVRRRVQKISFTETKLTVAAGSTARTRLVLEPADAAPEEILYSSGDPAVAQVDGEGNVTGVAPGRTTIRATAQDGSGRYGQLVVTVTEARKKLTLSPAELMLAAGQSAALTAAGPENRVWSSGDERVASVDRSGLVTAVGPGSCEIFCAAGGMTESARVTVVRPAQSIEAEPAQGLEITEGGQALISWQVLPLDTTDPSVTLTSTDPAVAQVDQTGAVTAVGAGTCGIVLTAADGSGVQTEVPVTVSAHTGLWVSPEELTLVIGQEAAVTAASGAAGTAPFPMSWTSDNETVASVRGWDSRPTIAGLRAGSAKITGFLPDKSASVTVRVTVAAAPSGPELTGAALEEGGLRLTVFNAGEETAARLYFEVYFYDYFGVLIPAGEAMEGQTAVCAAAIAPGQTAELTELIWETPPSSVRNLGRITVRLTGAEDADGEALPVREDRPAEAQKEGYLGYVPAFSDVSEPTPDQ